jgi:hypothetical protein
MSECSKHRPVLMLGASPRVSVPMARSLRRHGTPVDIASFQPEEPDIQSRSICGFHRLPPCRLDAVAFTRALLDLVRERHFDTILPAGDPPLAALRDLYQELSPTVHVGCPSPGGLERVLNKSLTLEAAQKVGIRVPDENVRRAVGGISGIWAQMRKTECRSHWWKPIRKKHK